MVGQSDIVRNPVRLHAEYTMLVGNVSSWRDFTLAAMSSKLRSLEVAYTRSVVTQLSRGLKHVLHQVYHGCVEVGVRHSCFPRFLLHMVSSLCRETTKNRRDSVVTRDLRVNKNGRYILEALG